ncbi:MAG: hypothetical protein HOP37_13385 [Cyclobacteriaceae bacterium]|nr:hypothetical protein [Cyclobacteriaceae bacterium]
MVRTLITPEDRNILIRVPEDYIGKQVEVIAFTLEENSNVTQVKKQVSFSALKLNTIGYKFNREEANER